MLPTPGFHHLHLNSVDPDAAIDWYVRQFPSCTKGEWGGFPALLSPNNVMVLFTKVAAPPPTEPQSAIWHFGWHVTDVRKSLATYQGRAEVKLLPLYTTDEGRLGAGQQRHLAECRRRARPDPARRSPKREARATQPPGGGGFAYMAGPDNALVEYAGNYPAERFNHVHLWQEEPLCALLWYQKHLNAPVRAGFAGPPPTEADCKVPRGTDRTWPALNREGMFRTPRAGVEFGDVVLTWYANQGETPLASPLGQLQDHIALSVADLDAWIAKLRGEGVTFLREPYRLGDDARGHDRGSEPRGPGTGRGRIGSAAAAGSNSSGPLLRGALTARLTGHARNVPLGGGSSSGAGSASTSPSHAAQSFGPITTGMRLCNAVISAFGRVVIMAKVRSISPPGARQLSQMPPNARGSPSVRAIA